MDNEVNLLSAENVEDIFALTDLQKNMLYTYLMDEESYKYYEQWRYKITGYLDIKNFKLAWQYVINNNEMLRCIYRWDGLKEPIQIILKNKKVEIKIYDLTKVGYEKVQFQADKIAQMEWTNKVDLQRDTFRISLTILSSNEYEMIISSHHILIDGWSNANILQEFIYYYYNLSCGNVIKYNKKTKFKEYVKILQKMNTKKDMIFWQNLIQGYSWQPDLDKSKICNKKSNIRVLHLSHQETKDIYTFCKNKDITFSVFMYIGWALIMHKYYETNDLAFGITLSGRNIDLNGVNDMVGLFIKTVPFRLSVTPASKINTILDTAKQLMIDIEEHDTVEISDLMCLSFETIKYINKFIIVIQNYPVGNLLNTSKELFDLRLYSSFYEISSDFVIGIKAFDSSTDIEVAYNQGLFQDDFVKQLLEDYKHIIMRMINEKTINELTVDTIIN